MLTNDKKAQERWTAYVRAEETRLRSETLGELEKFLELAGKYETKEKVEWAHWFCSRHMKKPSPSFPVRMPLFRELLFPGLLSGLLQRRKGCARWLGDLCQYMYKCQDLRLQLPEGRRSSTDLYRLAIEHDPDDTKAKRSLASSLRSSLEYSIHELPAGVLFGLDASTVESIKELMKELAEYRSVAEFDLEESEDLIVACDFHYQAYERYLQCKEDWTSYHSYLVVVHNDDWPDA